jgi:DNA modification methylase
MTILYGDCRQTLRTLADCSVDSIVTDPPYELGFMGKHWDASGIAYDIDMWRECLRVLKPGGHLLAFGGTRTYHRMAVAIEDAGFEVRDSIHWLYGSGFPKSLDVSKAIDKAAGVEFDAQPASGVGFMNANDDGYNNTLHRLVRTGSSTDAAKQWDGWGTALKPAHEPIVVARKPLVGTVAQNVLQHGTGALNIDGGRVNPGSAIPGGGGLRGGAGSRNAGWQRPSHSDGAATEAHFDGRWPANLVLTHAADCTDTCAADCPVAELDRQSGVSKDGVAVQRNGGGQSIWDSGNRIGSRDDAGYGGMGGASRFFTVTEWDPITDVPFRYVAKPGKTERNAGLDGLPTITAGAMTGRKDGSAGLNSARAGAGRTSGAANHHPTVKPVDLMRWLVRLVTPPGGTVLDPFLGSGTTAVAAILEGFDWVGCELTDDYLPIIEGRTAWARQHLGHKAPQRTPAPTVDQLDLFGGDAA